MKLPIGEIRERVINGRRVNMIKTERGWRMAEITRPVGSQRHRGSKAVVSNPAVRVYETADAKTICIGNKTIIKLRPGANVADVIQRYTKSMYAL